MHVRCRAVGVAGRGHASYPAGRLAERVCAVFTGGGRVLLQE